MNYWFVCVVAVTCIVDELVLLGQVILIRLR